VIHEKFFYEISNIGAPRGLKIPLEPIFSASRKLSFLFKNQLNLQNQKGGNDYGYKKSQ